MASHYKTQRAGLVKMRKALEELKQKEDKRIKEIKKWKVK